MQESAEIPSLLTRLLADVQNVDVLWQAGVLAACLLVAWLAARAFARRWTSADTKRLDDPLVLSLGGLTAMVGGQASLYGVPEALRPLYGGFLVSLQVFLRLTPSRMAHGPAGHGGH